MSKTELAPAGGAAEEAGPAKRALFKLGKTADADPAEFWPKLFSVLGRIPFADDLAAAWYCWLDPETPGHVKAVLAGAIAYFIVPADLLPDFVAGLGFTDDATVIATAIGMAGTHIKRRHRQAAKRLLGRNR